MVLGEFTPVLAKTRARTNVSGRMSGNSRRIFSWAGASSPAWTSRAARNCPRAGNAPWSVPRAGCVRSRSRSILW